MASKRIAKLLAKSGIGAPSLSEHTLHVMDAAEALFGTADHMTRLGTQWLNFFQIPVEHWSKFHANLAAACAMHDLGKANDGMQNVLNRMNGTTQAIRHEHLSALLIAQTPCWDWLSHDPELDRELILSAVLTHHLKAGSKLDGFAAPESIETKHFRSLHDSEDFRELIGSIAKRLQLPPLNLSAVPTRWTFGNGSLDVYTERNRVQDILQKFRRQIDPRLPTVNHFRRRLLSAVRSALIAADAAGSALVREHKLISQWIADQFDESKAWCGQSVWKNVIQKRIDHIQHRTGRAFEWNAFQKDCADEEKVPERALLISPCGSGKTLAAWRWIASQLDKRPACHVLFLYPTRATATEGFRDYVSWAPEAEAALMHGTSAFDLDGMFDNGADPRRESRYEADRRLFALGFWGRRAFSATVDQFLAFMNYGYSQICMLPVLADSVVVVDEVHSFDRNMFAALKGFLRNFNIPVLCMTATLLPTRRDELTKSLADDGCGLKLYDDRPEDLMTIADAKRYQLRRAVSADNAEVEVRKALKANKRVLWVVNTVKRAHAVVRRFVKQLPPDLIGSQEPQELHTTLDNGQQVPVICYHSRFRLSDRVVRHQATMRALKEQAGPALGITTQVCEMSLDIDVDLLVTEDCPVTSLVQRMGRCNRDRKARPLGDIECTGTAGDVLVYDPGEKTPYDEASLTGLKEFIVLLNDCSLSQMDLERAMEKIPEPPFLGDPLCSFLESGPYAVGPKTESEEAGTFREGKDFNRPCILASDVVEYLKPDPERKRQPGLIVPVPKKMSWERDFENPEHTKLPGYLGVAKNEYYHSAIGFCDDSVDQWRTT